MKEVKISNTVKNIRGQENVWRKNQLEGIKRKRNILL